MGKAKTTGTSEATREKKKVELKNILVDIQETLSPCIKCGMCKSLCPVFKTIKLEEISPRGHSIMLDKEILNELVYQCNLCKACEQNCPLNLKICDAILRAREFLVVSGKELETNKEMISLIRKTGNPFDENSSVSDDKLYCC